MQRGLTIPGSRWPICTITEFPLNRLIATLFERSTWNIRSVSAAEAAAARFAPTLPPMPYAFDDQHDPLISMHLHGWVTDNELERMLGDLDALVTRDRPFAMVLDCTSLRVPEIGHVRKLAEWFAHNREAASRCHRGVACVITTPMIRGTLGAVLQLQPMPMPVAVVETLADGRRWAEGKLARDSAS